MDQKKNGFRSIDVYNDILENDILRKSHSMKVYKKWQKRAESERKLKILYLHYIYLIE